VARRRRRRRRSRNTRVVDKWHNRSGGTQLETSFKIESKLKIKEHYYATLFYTKGILNASRVV